MTDQELDELLNAERKKPATITLKEIRGIVKKQDKHSTIRKVFFYGLNSFLILCFIALYFSSTPSLPISVKDVTIVEFTPKSTLVANTKASAQPILKIEPTNIKKTLEEQAKKVVLTSKPQISKEKIDTVIKNAEPEIESHNEPAVEKTKYNYILHPTKKGITEKTNYNYILYAGATKEDVHSLFSRLQQIGAKVKLKKEKYDKHGKLKKIAFMNGKMDFEPHKFEKIMFIVMNTSDKRVEVVIINGIRSSY